MAEEGKEDSHVMGRKLDRPLPPRGCSVAFFLFFALLLTGLAIAFFFYRNK
ncbi:MAG: hypothetical protein SPJ13_08265 [Bacteroidales bacterium]|nr:hypothetical protein [Bacteroidales bacterium]